MVRILKMRSAKLNGCKWLKTEGADKLLAQDTGVNAADVERSRQHS